MTPHSLELDYLCAVIRRQADRPCSFSRTETGLNEFARITHRISRLERPELRLIEREVSRLLAEGFFCDVCRWKLLLVGSLWMSEKLPLVAWRFRNMIPGRSQLRAAGRDLEAEIEAAIHPYRRLG